MAATSAAVSPERSNALKAIIFGGLTAGTLDLTAACIYSTLLGGSAVGVMKSIASGVLGAGAFQGGAGVAALGVALHFVIALGAATVYYLASRKLRFLARQPLIFGPLYGLAVYAFMNLVVLPLSAISFKPNYAASRIIINILILMVCIGPPIALFTRRYSQR